MDKKYAGSFFKSPPHCLTEDLYLQLRKEHQKIGDATVRRTSECGLDIEFEEPQIEEL